MEKVVKNENEFIESNIKKLKEIFPECVNDNKINFDVLRNILSNEVVETNEKYGLNWVGKMTAQKMSVTPSAGTLRPIKNSSVNWESTRNVYIEADNEEALKLLSKTYHNKVDIIYIDPPYNTGKDFVYKDDYKDSLKKYFEVTNQINKANPETLGKYHTNWLNFIYPRLKISHELLKDDGIIFISINDIELSNIKKVTDEIFGEDNFVANIVWTNNEGGGSSDSKFFKIKHEYILCYAKNIKLTKPIKELPVEDEDRYKLSDEFESTRGKYQLVKLSSASIQYSDSLTYPINCPDGSIVYPSENSNKEKAIWRWSKKKFEWGIENKFIVFKKDKSGIWQVYTKQYLNCDKDGNIVRRTKKPLGFIDKFSSTQASNHLFNLFKARIFDYPKPVELIQYLLERFSDNDSIILDFFSGSGTTAEAVFKLNSLDNGNRKFIMIQLPENYKEDDEAFAHGYKTICQAAEDRIKKCASLYNDNIDLGFKVFKLDSTNIKPWDSTIKYDSTSIFGLTDVIKDNRTPEDVAYEIMLKYGIFDQQLKEIELNNKKIFSVGENYMIISLNDVVETKDIESLLELKPEIVVFKESGFKNDNDKLNAEHTLKKFGVKEIKCI